MSLRALPSTDEGKGICRRQRCGHGGSLDLWMSECMNNEGHFISKNKQTGPQISLHRSREAQTIQKAMEVAESVWVAVESTLWGFQNVISQLRRLGCIRPTGRMKKPDHLEGVCHNIVNGDANLNQ